MDGRQDLFSRQSTSSTGSGVALAPSCSNCMELLHDLYQKLEPQISKSYRPNVKYVPSKEPEVKHVTYNESNERNIQEKSNKQKQLKTAKIVIGAVTEMQKRRDSTRRDSTVSIKKKFGDLARRASAQGLGDGTKGVSQSLPDLTETDS